MGCFHCRLPDVLFALWHFPDPRKAHASGGWGPWANPRQGEGSVLSTPKYMGADSRGHLDSSPRGRRGQHSFDGVDSASPGH